jgi:FKBP-type peptidyl-prolyl cis-trans isomerase FkpA/FKBP-type peptidyl-prolyl cis-trans isomerase FklB
MSRSIRQGLLVLLVAAVALFSGSAPRAEEGAQALGTEQQNVLYALGVAFGYQLKQFALSPAELEVMSQGLRDAALERPLKADPFELQAELNALGEERRVVRMEQERKASLVFVASAAREEGAVQTESGLVIRELVAGTGASPQPTSVVRVHYHGTLRDGMVFDSTIPKGTPATFHLNGVIACWEEGLQRMKVGGRSRLVCPASIAYGEGGLPPMMIPPAAALTFEMELIEIVN